MGFGKEVWKNNHLRDVLTSKVRTNDATMQETWLRWGASSATGAFPSNDCLGTHATTKRLTLTDHCEGDCEDVKAVTTCRRYHLPYRHLAKWTARWA